MPLYEYECDACAHRFEVIHQKFSDAPVETCPRCGGVVRKLLSSPAIQFKGTGWYITDYARSGKTDGKSETGKGEGEKGESAKNESKNEGKTEGKGEGQGDSGKSESGKSSESAGTASETKAEGKTEAKPQPSSPQT